MTACLASCKRKFTDKSELPPPDFPFTLEDEYSSLIYIAPQYYNQENLHNLFIWHYKKSLTTRVAPQVWVFTDKRLLDLYIADRSKGFIEYPPGEAGPTPSSTPWYHSRTYYYDADYSIVPSEPSLDMNKGDDRTSRGYNVTYSFAPDLSKPNERREVVLRGATWREGKYNVETREFPWSSGKITLKAYDIYNVEPSGRYYTFTVPQMIGDYEGKSIIFNILPDRPVPFDPNQVKIFNDKIAYVYLGWMFSVTLDGGRSWHLWDGERKLPEWQCCDPGLIQEVEISDQGTGVMTLKPDPKRPESMQILRTTDFGQNWK